MRRDPGDSRFESALSLLLNQGRAAHWMIENVMDDGQVTLCSKPDDGSPEDAEGR
jgi:hypothetical protein